MALVFLWFGVQQFLKPADWTGYIPSWASIIPLSPTALVYANATLEVVLGAFLILGIFTRISALILAIHLGVISVDMFQIGSAAIGVRDFGLAMATLTIAIASEHSHTIGKKYMAYLKHKFPSFGKENSH